MKLAEATARYVAHKQSMGMRFRTDAVVLKALCNALGDVTMQEVRPDRVQAYIVGLGPATTFCERKYTTLKGFYQFAIARDYIAYSPLPRAVCKSQQAFVPYIYSRAELRCLLDTIIANDHPCSSIDPDTYQSLLLVLYGAALRIGEALALTLADVDLTACILHIRESKFYKTRLVPMGPDLLQIVDRHVTRRWREGATPNSPLFYSRRGQGVSRSAAEITFKRLRRRAGVLRNDGGVRGQPRLHDLRHSFAVHRLVSWYRCGADVQRLLPQLSTFLGHRDIAATQRYLTLTPELLHEASARFEGYALGDPT
jgi:site-specific recombinase XerD